MPTDEQILRFLSNPVNVLYALDWRNDQCGFVPASRQALSELPFLDNRTLGTSQKKAALPVAQIRSAVAKEGFPYRGTACDFLFHSAFCCSTLIARCLDVPGKCLSLKEPFALLGVSGFMRNHPSSDAWEGWADIALALLSRPFSPSERTLLKPSNGANNLLPEILARPGAGKTVLLYSSLESFLVSVISGGAERAQFTSGILPLFLKDFGEDLADVKPTNPLEEAALVWGLQVRLFERTAKGADPEKVRTLDCQRFLDDPAATLGLLSEFYGYGLGPDEISTIVEGPLMGRHAKEGRDFSADERDTEKKTILKERKAEIKAAVSWAKGGGFDFAAGFSNPL